MKSVLVVGAGAAGLIAGAFAARNGARTEIIERNEKAGKKLFLTGKGRCNITNSADKDEFMKAIVHNGRFMFNAPKVVCFIIIPIRRGKLLPITII